MQTQLLSGKKNKNDKKNSKIQITTYIKQVIVGPMFIHILCNSYMTAAKQA